MIEKISNSQFGGGSIREFVTKFVDGRLAVNGATAQNHNEKCCKKLSTKSVLNAER
jgi:hypothetical protein